MEQIVPKAIGKGEKGHNLVGRGVSLSQEDGFYGRPVIASSPIHTRTKIVVQVASGFHVAGSPKGEGVEEGLRKWAVYGRQIGAGTQGRLLQLGASGLFLKIGAQEGKAGDRLIGQWV